MDGEVDFGSDGFHEVEGERGSGPLIGVEYGDAGVEADTCARDGGFGFEEGVQVVEYGVRRVDGESGSGGESGASGAEGSPVVGDSRDVSPDETNRESVPGLQVGSGCL